MAERMIEPTEIEFRTAVENMRDAFGMYSPIVDQTGEITDFRIDYVNASACKLNQMTKAELIGKRLCELFPGIRESGLFDAYRRVVETKEPFSTVYQFVPDNGGQYRTKGFYELHAAYRRHGFVASWRDITERVVMEQILRESEELHRITIENILDPIFITDAEGRFTYICRNILHILGYTVDEIYAMNNISALLGEGLFTLEELHRRGEIFNIETIITKKSGEKRNYLVTVKSVSIKEGKILYACHDITTRIRFQEARKRAEKALLESERKWRNILVNIPQIAVSLDPGARVIFANAHFLKLTGWTEDKVIGQNWLDMFIPESGRKKIREKFDSAIQEKGAFEFSSDVNPILTKSGELLDVAWSSYVAKDAKGGVSEITCLGIDLTERKRSEEKLRQAHKMEAISTLTGGIAHEFNNMLGIIIGNAELAIDDIPEWNPAAKGIKEILTASFRARDVVKKLLTVARKTPSTRKPVKICRIVEESLALLRPAIPPNIEIRSNIRCASERILADTTEITELLINLCTNAAHAMGDEAGVLGVGLETVTIGAQASAGPLDLQTGEYVKLTVTDTGSGIEPEIMERIWDPYFTSKDVGKGLGMGLSIAQSIVKKHEGLIEIHSQIGRGTTAEVLFPLAAEQPEVEIEEKRTIPNGNGRILLVDDEALLVKMVKSMLERAGHEVHSTTSSLQALELFKKNPGQFDLIITDMTMPEMSGDRLVQEIARIQPDIPVILCTGHRDLIDAAEAKKLGIDAYLIKPFSEMELCDTVQKFLKATNCASSAKTET